MLHKGTYAREILLCGDNIWWNNDKLLNQMEKAIKIIENKFGTSEHLIFVWIFDNAPSHVKMSDDALNAYKMNKSSGGKQSVMRDTAWKGKIQRLVFKNTHQVEIPKGLEQVSIHQCVDIHLQWFDN